MFGRLNGIVFALLLFVTSLMGTIFILIPIMPLAYFFPKLFRFAADRCVGYWLIFPASMLFFIFPIKFCISGDIIDRNKPALIIMNHRTRLDWLFFWCALYKMDPWLLTTEKISLKSDLKRIPGAGWAMGCAAYIFMNRNYESDYKILAAMLKYYKDTEGTYQLLLFPEGTDRSQRALERSNAFADKNLLPRYDYVLHPRTTGFNFILKQMLKDNYINDGFIYDVTIGYPENIVSSEFELIRTGIFPKSVHFDICKYEISGLTSNLQNNNNNNNLESDELNFANWLNNLWREKESRLKEFYGGETAENRKFKPSGKGYRWPITNDGLAYYIAFCFWIVTSLAWIYYALFCGIFVKIFIVSSIAFYIWADKHSGGVEFLAMEWFYGKKLNNL